MSSSETPWEFLPTADGAPPQPSAEETAMHVERDGPIDLSEIDDVAVSESSPVDADADADAEHDGAIEPSVHDLMEQQGYSFEESDGDGPDVDLTSDWRAALAKERNRISELRAAIDHEMPLAASQRDVDGELATSGQHPADDASMTFERELEHSIAHQLERELAEVDDALRRIDAGTYGRCQVCDGPIGDGRLRAEPATRFCINHQRALGAVAELS